MISVLKENTKGLTHMNKNQMCKIIEEKGLTDKAFEIEKNRERRPCMRSMEVKVPRNRRKIVLKYYGKCCTLFIYNTGKVWENKKINVIEINQLQKE